MLTETVCDLANNELRARGSSPRAHSTAHRLEAVAATPPPADAVVDKRKGETTTHTVCGRHVHQGRLPVAAVDVYVDDFLLMAQTVPQ